MVESDTLADSERGEGGYGSTGESAINAFSAVEGSSGYPEQKSELTDQETTSTASGEAQSSLEQAQ